MNPRSIRSRLTIWYFCVLFTGLMLFGAGIWGYLALVLKADKETTLRNRVARMVSYLERKLNQNEPIGAGDYDSVLWSLPEGNMTQIFDTAGNRIVPRDPNSKTLPWPSANDKAGYGRMTVNGIRYWTIERIVHVHRTDLRINIASQYEENFALLNHVRLAVFGVMPLMLLLSSYGGYVLSGRALRPVSKLARAAEQIGEHDLSRRLPIPDTRDELQHLAEIFDALLRRLESALNRQRKFTADASHDLRTPLTTARTTAEVTLRGSDSMEGLRESLGGILGDLADMESILDDMLLLARMEAETVEMPTSPVPAAALILEPCQRMRGSAIAKGLNLEATTSFNPDLLVLANKAAFRRVITSLIENSIRYTPRGGSIEVLASVDGNCLVCVVRDSGIGISAEALPHIFERFYRADPARAIDTGGSGLGLAIAKWTVERHEGTIRAESTEGHGTSITVTLPLFKAPRVS